MRLKDGSKRELRERVSNSSSHTTAFSGPILLQVITACGPR